MWAPVLAWTAAVRVPPPAAAACDGKSTDDSSSEPSEVVEVAMRGPSRRRGRRRRLADDADVAGEIRRESGRDRGDDGAEGLSFEDVGGHGPGESGPRVVAARSSRAPDGRCAHGDDPRRRA
jgi:hypothetical protein